MTNEADRDYYSLKPAVRIGSYFFKWSDNDYGICPSESTVFKNFIRKMIPLLEHYMNILNFEYKNNSQKKLLGDKKHHICIVEKYSVNVSFIMFIDSSGSTVFYREEKFHAVSKDFEIPEDEDEGGEDEEGKDHNRFVLQIINNKNKMTKYNIVSLKWLIGELLFDRLKTTN
ncbi:hypothetical protein BH23THE1_BH23THE1_08700 [soil metagenome]